MRLVVVGVGAIGGSLAVRLVQAGHEVVAVARGEHLERIRAEGLRLRTPEEDVVVPLEAVGGVDEVGERGVDAVLVTTKSQDTAGVAHALAGSALARRPVVCAQNGVRNEDVVAGAGLAAYGALVMMPAAHLRPGEVQAYSSPTVGMVDVGVWPSGTDDVAAGVADALRSAGVDSRTVADIARWKYRKLLVNLGNAVTALCGRSAPVGVLLERAEDEGRAVLDAAGIDYASAEEDATRRGRTLQVRSIGDEERAGSSTWQSLARATGDSEVDELNGQIVRLGARVGAPTPVNATLARLVAEAARTRRGPGLMTVGEVLAQVEEASSAV
ncbi:2-dehydropantoate 2-reductase [Phycicoccus endophyticus]|uniref:2-dehydropantoate 2-reductase n=1 Tax=Phycicoccus endophyticus TaxID=1690220 RepID=A0A7G9R4L7_9MICO|nr:2-dehydropantoate 2-reductase [Phycicoccus endophyticus]NHI18439.1 2-dehydropantoate 2-reductase [Phycicoccus endophyticus]QNN50542.1 2-dehydropantoate 2-reductase [Phycicoccus endophyticus]GGL23759.1 2-dehydropantoate 2-reductase [Phycicoccus endophyticus]